MLLEPGAVIDGKYRLIRLIGVGGMGAVYEGENVLIRRRVAIKVLSADAAATREHTTRFEREAQAAGRIGNEHILEVLDLGALPSGQRYMVMEYLEGETLAQRIERYGRLTPAQIAPIALQFLSALASAHDAGIIHRDLKPDNIFILRLRAGRADFVKLIDFGISKFSDAFSGIDTKTTHADVVLGTPCYMSPEQARGAHQTDERSDVYSCGVILYEAVTGRLPFEAPTFNELLFKIALEDAPSPLVNNPSLDADFARIISRATSRDRNARYGSAREFAEAIEAWMGKRHSLTESVHLLGSVSTPSVPSAPHLGTVGGAPGYRGLEALTMETSLPSAGQGLDAKLVHSLGQPTGSHKSWSTTGQTTRRRMIWSAGSLVGLGAAAVAVAFFLRAPGSGPSSHAPPSVAAASPSTPPATSLPVTSSADGWHPVPFSSPSPSASSSAASGPRSPGGALGLQGGRATKAAATAGRSAPVSKSKRDSDGFELGY